MTRRDTIAGLRYIAEQPKGILHGFNPYTVEIAKSALKLITKKSNKR